MNNILFLQPTIEHFKTCLMVLIISACIIPSISAQCSLTCLNQVNVQVPEVAGNLEVTADMLIIGDYSNCPNFQTQVRITDELGSEIATSPNVTTADVGRTYTYEVSELTSGNLCWGLLQVYADGPVELKVGSATTVTNEAICIPVQVFNFYDMYSAAMRLTWDPTAISYEYFGNTLFDQVGIDDSEISSGILDVYWEAGNIDEVVTYPNGSNLFSLCFIPTIESDASDICFASSATGFEKVENSLVVPVAGNTECGQLTALPCVISCLPELTVSLNGADEREFEATDFLFQDNCQQTYTFEFTDANNNSLGQTITSAQLGQNVTATLSDTDGLSCETLILVYDCSTAPVNIEFAQSLVNNQLVLEAYATNVTDMFGFQMALDYNPASLEFSELVFHPALLDPIMTASSGVNEEEGIIRMLAMTNIQETFSLDNGDLLFTLTLDVVQNINSQIQLSYDIDPMFISGSNEEICINLPPTDLYFTGSGVEGHIYDDVNQDCAISAEDLDVSGWLIELVDATTSATFYGRSSQDGSYVVFAPPGTYTVTVYSPNDLWSFCSNSIVALLPNDEDTETINFFAQANILCPDMYVDAGTPFLRRCFDNTYKVEYCNRGTQLAESAYIEIELDPTYIFVSTDALDYTIVGSLLTVQLGDVPYGECGEFKFTVNIDCNTAVIGQTHCVTSTIFPNDYCFEARPEWSGASLVVEGECDGDSTNFLIRNVGVGDMLDALEYIVIEDDVMKPGGSILLGANETYAVDPFPADGKTYRVTVPQVADHPSMNMPTLAIEGCGANNTGTFSTGFVTMFPGGDGDAYIDEDCVENIGSYDPNDKAVTPKGYTDKNFVEANTTLDYHIRFQNTGTDTAFRVIVLDELDENLDLSTLELGAYSHRYELRIIDGRTLEFRFDNIMLVDSVANEPQSHGFIKFKIDQVADLPDGVQIKNDAAIYFDFNEPVITNETVLEIGRADGTYTIDLEDISFSLYPNPATDYINVTHAYNKGPITLKIYNQVGQLVKLTKIDSTDRISVEDLSNGLYEFELVATEGQLATGKFNVIR